MGIKEKFRRNSCWVEGEKKAKGDVSWGYSLFSLLSFLGCGGGVLVVIHTCAFPMRCISLRSSTVPFFSGGKSVRVRVSSTATMYEASSCSLPMAKGFRCAMVGFGFVCFEGWWKTKMMMMTGKEGEGMRESEDFHSLVWLAQLVQDLFLLSHSLCLSRVPCQGFQCSVLILLLCPSRFKSFNKHTHSLSHPPPPPPPPRLERNPAFTYQDCTTVYSLVLSLLWCGGFRDYVVFLADNVYSQGLHPRRTRTFGNVQATGRTAQRSKRSLTHDP